MASITIRNLDDDLKARLCLRAAGHGCSLEEEVHNILREAVERQAGPTDLAAALRNRFLSLGGIELEAPRREPVATRNTRDFEGAGVDLIDPWDAGDD